MKIAVIGGGFCGLAAAYEVCNNGHQVQILDRDTSLGGLASTFSVGGQKLEKFYHHWLGTDEHIFQFIRELGFEKKLLFKESKVGIYYANTSYKFSSPIDLIKFKPLPFFSRIRFGFSILYSWYIRDPKYLETISAEKWLLKITGQNAYDVIWKPLLIGKFGEQNYKDVAAIWIWNKLIQRGKSRDKKAKEFLGYYEGGFTEFIEDLKNKILEKNGRIRLSTEVKKILIAKNDKLKLKYENKWHEFDKVIYTGHNPEFAELLENSGYNEVATDYKKINYLGNVCLILVTSQSLSEHYWLNVNDLTFPFVGIIEHTNFENKSKYKGRHLIYLSKYVPTDSELYKMSSDQMKEFAVPHLKRLFPNFDEKTIIKSILWKTKYAQPIIGKNYSKMIPKVETQIPNLFFSSMSQVYPEDRGTNYAIYHGRKIGKKISE